MTKIDIFSGFLGAGKTTLIKKLIAEAYNKEKLVLIENEFGEIGIDGGFMKEAGVQITEMNSGCICCTLTGDFQKALKKVIEDYSPERILIEPSGVGKLSDVMRAVEKVAENGEVELNSCIAVVDASKCKMYMKNFGEFFNNQIEFAGTIILSRTQMVSEDKLAQCMAMIREHNSKAVLLTTPWDELPGEKILEAIDKKDTLLEELLSAAKASRHDDEEDEHEHHHHHHDDDDDEEDEHEHHHHHDENGNCSCGHHHEGHHHADEVFESWGLETAKKYTTEKIDYILKALDENSEYGAILRAKGIVQNTNGTWIHFDYVPGEHDFREGTADYTGRFCVIGSKLNKEKLKTLFEQ